MNERKRLMEYINRGFDLNFAADIEPDGNPYFTSEYMRFGQGFITCLNVFQLPTKQMQDFWITPLTQNDNTVTVIDFGTKDKSETIRELRNAIKNTKSNFKSGGEEIAQHTVIENYRQQVEALDKVLTNDVIKTLDIRIFVYDDTYEKLMDRVQDIIDTLAGKNILVGINADEMPYNYKSMFMPISKQQYLPNRPIPNQLTSDNLAGGYFFNHIHLDDPNGEFIGRTSTNGAVNFDMWQRDDTRTNSNMIFLGTPGQGKSTLLKELTEGNFVRNNFIRNFDVVGEYQDLTRQMGGKIVSIDGSQGSINPLQIFPTVTERDGKTIYATGSFYNHVNKLRNMFHFIDSTLDDSTLNLLETLIKNFYVQQRMWVDDSKHHPEDIKLFLPNNQYPLMHDFLTYLHQAKEAAMGKGDSSENIDRISKLSLVAQNMVENYQDMFDTHTNINDFEHEQVVTFDLSKLKAMGEGVFNAQVYSMLSLTSSHAINNGRRELQKYENKQIDIREVRHYIINIDECQNIINPRFPFGVQYIAQLEEEMRKAFCGIALATPSIETILPSKSVNADANYEREVAKLFGNTQYRFFFQLDSSSLDRLAETMGKSMTRAELSSIPSLKRGHCVLNLAPRRNVPIEVIVSDVQQSRYHGGV